MLKISNEEFKRRMDLCLSRIPRFDWFTEAERVNMMLEAEETAAKCNQNSFIICENLAFMRSFEKDRRPSAHQ